MTPYRNSKPRGSCVCVRAFVVTGVLVAALALIGAPGAAAASPANDDFANATVIDPSALPFNDTLDLSSATVEAGEPFCQTSTNASVWYSITPATTEVIRVNTSNAFFAPILNAYLSTGGGFAGLQTANFNSQCVFYGPLSFTAQAGQTYYIQVASSFFGSTADLSVSAVLPPVNDNFTSATTIPSLPFNDTVDMTAASIEPGEPTIPQGAFTPIGATVWYAFTPSVNESITATPNACCVTPILTAYTGSALTNLTEVIGRSGFSPVTLAVTAGTTYYLQLGAPSPTNALMSINVVVTPPPVASFFFVPQDPSTVDSVQFIDQSNDPGQLGFSSETWDLGDGTHLGNPGCCPVHRYAADGDYPVTLTVTTLDGRTASTKQTVHVRTHDVSITKFSAPTSAGVGQTRTLTVGLSNKRYPETVQVQLLRSNSSGGFDVVGTLTNAVPLTTGNSTIPFGFSYTFTKSDAALGKVTFEAVATIVGARDALPADNTAIAAPTIVH